MSRAEHEEREMDGTTPERAIAQYLSRCPEQGDWPWEDHCEGVASGILVALRTAGFMVMAPVNYEDCYECGQHVDPLDGEAHGRAGYVHYACMAPPSR